MGDGRLYKVVMVLDSHGKPLPPAELEHFARDGPRVMAECSILADDMHAP